MPRGPPAGKLMTMTSEVADAAAKVTSDREPGAAALPSIGLCPGEMP
jgi:hypothetical protein